MGCTLTPRRSNLIKITGIVPIFLNPEEGIEWFLHIPNSPTCVLKTSSTALRTRWLQALQEHIDYANSHKEDDANRTKPESPIRDVKFNRPLTRSSKNSPLSPAQQTSSLSLIEKPNLKERAIDEYTQALEDLSQQILRRLIRIEQMNARLLQPRTVTSLLFQNYTFRELLFVFLLGFFLSRFIIS